MRVKLSNTTRRHPRTLQEAFGPYCDSRIHDADARERLAHRVMYGLVVAFALLAAAGVFGA